MPPSSSSGQPAPGWPTTAPGPTSSNRPPSQHPATPARPGPPGNEPAPLTPPPALPYFEVPIHGSEHLRTAQVLCEDTKFTISTNAEKRSRQLQLKTRATHNGNEIDFLAVSPTRHAKCITTLKWKLENDIFSLYGDANIPTWQDERLLKGLECLGGCFSARLFESPWDCIWTGPHIAGGDLGEGQFIRVHRLDKIKEPWEDYGPCTRSQYSNPGDLNDQIDTASSDSGDQPHERLKRLGRGSFFSFLRVVELITAQQIHRSVNLPARQVASLISRFRPSRYGNNLYVGMFKPRVPTLYGMFFKKFSDFRGCLINPAQTWSPSEDSSRATNSALHPESSLGNDSLSVVEDAVSGGEANHHDDSSHHQFSKRFCDIWEALSRWGKQRLSPCTEAPEGSILSHSVSGTDANAFVEHENGVAESDNGSEVDAGDSDQQVSRFVTWGPITLIPGAYRPGIERGKSYDASQDEIDHDQEPFSQDRPALRSDKSEHDMDPDSSTYSLPVSDKTGVVGTVPPLLHSDDMFGSSYTGEENRTSLSRDDHCLPHQSYQECDKPDTDATSNDVKTRHTATDDLPHMADSLGSPPLPARNSRKKHVMRSSYASSNDQKAAYVAKDVLMFLLSAVTTVLSILVVVFDPAGEKNWFKRIEQGGFVLFSLGIPLILVMKSRLTENLDARMPEISRPASLQDLKNMKKGTSDDEFIEDLAKAILVDEEISDLFSFKNACYKKTRVDGPLKIKKTVEYGSIFKEVWFFGDRLCFNKLTGKAFKYLRRDRMLVIDRQPADVEGVIVHLRRRRSKCVYRIGEDPGT